MYCECGCGGVPKIAGVTRTKLGHVKGQHKRFINGHNGRIKLRWKVDVDTGCWNWLLSIQPDGYGRGRRTETKQNIQAHIEVYELFVGQVPDGLELDHLCRNRRCVNPSHLEPVTQAVNIRRGRVAKLNEQTVKDIRLEFLEGNTNYNRLAKKHKVTLGCIKEIILYKTWKGV